MSMIESDENKSKTIITSNSAFNYLNNWYENYQKIIRFLSVIALSILFFTTTTLVKDVCEKKYTDKITVNDLNQLKIPIVFFGASLLLSFVCIIATYNWYIQGVSYFMKKTEIDFQELGDPFKYRKRSLTMKTWGWISYFSGTVSGIALTIGIVWYIWNSWDLLKKIW